MIIITVNENLCKIDLIINWISTIKIKYVNGFNEPKIKLCFYKKGKYTCRSFFPNKHSYMSRSTYSC